MAKVSQLFASAWVRAAVAAAVVLGAVALIVSPAAASPALTVTQISWNIVGLDSNNVNVGPNEFPVAARVCNTGDAPASNASVGLDWTTANANIALVGGTSRSLGTIAAGACKDAYLTVAVTRSAAAYNTARRFTMTATADGGVSASTPAPREIYVEKLVSQNRNAIASITGPTTVYLGDTATYVLDGSTATQGYEQLEAFLNLDPNIFEVQAVTATYSSPAGATNDKVWADACRFDFDPTSGSYRSCVGPNLYTGGKAGGTIQVTYTVKVVGLGASSMSAMIYDYSGSSYHYNSDFGGVGINATALPSADVSVTSAHVDPFTKGTDDAYTWTVANTGPSDAAGPVVVTSTLPGSVSFVSGSGSGAVCGAVAQVVTCTLAGGLPVGASVPLTINVAVSNSALASFTPSVTATSTTHDPNTANNTATDPTTTVAGPTTTTTSSTTSTTEPPTTTTSTTEPPPTTTSTTEPPTTTSSTTTSTTVAPTTTSTTAAPTSTTTSTTGVPSSTTTTTSSTTTSTTIATTTTSTSAAPTSTTTSTTVVASTTTTAKPLDSAVDFVVDKGKPLPPIAEPGDEDATFTFIDGQLPPGLWLTPDGSFGGTPSEVGTYEFNASVCQPSGVCTVRHVTVKVLGVDVARGPDSDPATPLARTGQNLLPLLAFGLLLLVAGRLVQELVDVRGDRLGLRR